MSEDDGFDELGVTWEEEGVLVVRELDRAVLQKGSGWATIAFLFEERDEKTGEFGPPKVNLRRYRKRAGRWQVQGKLVLSSGEQARALAKALKGWFPAKKRSGSGSK